MLRDRISLISEMEGIIGTYYSQDWVRKNILKMTDSEIDTMKSEIKAENESGESDIDDQEPEPEGEE